MTERVDAVHVLRKEFDVCSDTQTGPALSLSRHLVSAGVHSAHVRGGRGGVGGQQPWDHSSYIEHQVVPKDVVGLKYKLTPTEAL